MALGETEPKRIGEYVGGNMQSSTDQQIRNGENRFVVLALLIGVSIALRIGIILILVF